MRTSPSTSDPDDRAVSARVVPRARATARDRDAKHVVARLSRARTARATVTDRRTVRCDRRALFDGGRSCDSTRATTTVTDGRATTDRPTDAPWVLRFGARRRPRSARRSVGVDCLRRERGRRSPRRSERSRRACGADARRARVDARAMQIGVRGAVESLIMEARRTEGTGGSECTTRTGRRRLGGSTEARTR